MNFKKEIIIRFVLFTENYKRMEENNIYLKNETEQILSYLLIAVDEFCCFHCLSTVVILKTNFPWWTVRLKKKTLRFFFSSCNLFEIVYFYLVTKCRGLAAECPGDEADSLPLFAGSIEV